MSESAAEAYKLAAAASAANGNNHPKDNIHIDIITEPLNPLENTNNSNDSQQQSAPNPLDSRQVPLNPDNLSASLSLAHVYVGTSTAASTSLRPARLTPEPHTPLSKRGPSSLKPTVQSMDDPSLIPASHPINAQPFANRLAKNKPNKIMSKHRNLSAYSIPQANKSPKRNSPRRAEEKTTSFPDFRGAAASNSNLAFNNTGSLDLEQKYDISRDFQFEMEATDLGQSKHEGEESFVTALLDEREPPLQHVRQASAASSANPMSNSHYRRNSGSLLEIPSNAASPAVRAGATRRLRAAQHNSSPKNINYAMGNAVQYKYPSKPATKNVKDYFSPLDSIVNLPCRQKTVVTFSSRSAGSSALFAHEKYSNNTNDLDTAASARRKLANRGSTEHLICNDEFSAAHRLASGGLVSGADQADTINHANNNNNINNSNGIHAESEADYSLVTDLPTYTRLLRVLLLCMGVLGFSSTRRLFYFNYIWPAAIFTYFLFNIFFVASMEQFAHNNTDHGSGLKIIAQICSNSGPLLAWVGCFYYIGYNRAREKKVFLQLKNLEQFRPRLVRYHLLGSIICGSAFVIISLGTLPAWTFENSGKAIASLNLAMFLLLNYLLVSIVVLCLCSLLCRFHSIALLLYIDQLFDSNLTVVEAIREHVVLMRLMRQSAKYLQWMIGPPLIAYITGFLLMFYLMLSTANYSSLSHAAEQIILAALLFMLPLYTGSQITSLCRQISTLCRDIDCVDTLIERNSLIQQLVLLPFNNFQILDVTVTSGRLWMLLYIILAALLILIRGAFFQA
jgi:hypothetical protein